MQTSPRTLLRIYLGEADRADGRPLYEALVLKAREMGLAGATVLRGPMGFGHTTHLHTAKILRLSHDLPMIVELVDERTKLERFLEQVTPTLGHAFATLQAVELFRPDQPAETPAGRGPAGSGGS
jgi:PII-like signaling protein